MIKEPMLAAKEGSMELLIARLEKSDWFPGLGSPKLDGIRAFVNNDPGDSGLYSRKLKLIPNAHTQTQFGTKELSGLDGELIVGKPNAEDVFRVTLSGVMTHSTAPPSVCLYVFDDFTLHASNFMERVVQTQQRCIALRARGFNVQWVPHTIIADAAALRAFHLRCLLAGYEGSMYRAPSGPYKQGRSTGLEGYLFKLKEFEDGEAKIIGMVEGTHNDNEKTINELGRSKRSSHKAGKRASGAMGAFICQMQNGVTFQCGNGPGLTKAVRDDFWARQEEIVGNAWLKYTSIKIGVKDKPRHPQYAAVIMNEEMDRALW